MLPGSLVVGSLLLALQVGRELKASWPALMLVAPCVLGLRWERLEFRPQLFSTLLLSTVLWVLISIHTGRRSWRRLWLLPPLFALWINLAII